MTHHRGLGLPQELLVLWVALVFGTAVPVGAVPLGSSEFYPISPEAYYQQGVAALSKGDLKEAEAAFQGSLKLAPKQVESLLGLAEVSLKKGRPQEAREHLQRARDLDSMRLDVQKAWARFLYTQKQFSEAEVAFKKAIELDPELISSRLDLGDLYLLGLRKPKEAIETYRAAIVVDPNHPGARYALGTALAEMGAADKAMVELKEAARLAPDNPLPFAALGRLHASRKEFDKALGAFAAALKANPQFVQASLARGDIYGARGEDHKALEEYQAALKVAPKFAEAQVRIGVIHERGKRYADAERAYLAAVEANPKFAVAYNNLAWMAADRKAKLDDALAWARKAVDLAPNVAGYQDTLGWVHRARGELDKAVAVLEKAASIKPEQAQIVYHLGLVYADKGKSAEAVKAFNQALALKKDFPGSEDARQRLASLTSSPKR
jgi:tetratricopeptide (TPR) repeat protein